MLRKARQTGLLENISYGELLEDLSNAWRMVEGPEEASNDDKYWFHILNCIFEELEVLRLSKSIPKLAPKNEEGQERVQPKLTQSGPVGEPKRIPNVCCRIGDTNRSNNDILVDINTATGRANNTKRHKKTPFQIKEK